MGLITADDGVWAAVEAAVGMVNFADCWSPMTETIAEAMNKGVGGPFALGEASAKWYDAASKIQQAQQGLVERAGQVPRDYWDGSDRDAFDTEISNLAAELGDGHNYAMAVAITLTGLTVPLGAWPVVCDGIGIVESVNAAAFYVAAASIIGDLGASETLFAEGEAVTATCLTIIETSLAIIIGLLAAATAAIAISDVADINTQKGHGDTGITGEFVKAAITSAPEAAMSVFLHHLSTKGEGEGEGGAAGEGEGGAAGGSGSAEGEGGATGEGEGGATGERQGGEDAGSETAGGDDHGYGDGYGGEPDGAQGSSGEGSGGEGSGGEGSGGEGGSGEHHDGPIVDHAKERARDVIGEGASGELSKLINNGLGAAGLNKPDAPTPTQEQWGAGE